MKLLPITITGKTLSTTASPAVKGDKDIDALSIAVPITYEGTNLAQDAWHIRFKLPGGTVHIDPLTDGVPDDAESPTIITFTYPMQGLIVSQSGNVALQIINVPADGSSIFQTLPGPSITVSSTLEGPPSADYNAAPWGTYLAQYIAIRDETKQYRDQAQQIASDIHDEYVLLDEKKVDKVVGKGLSTEDYTTEEKSKLAGIESGAQANAVVSVAGKTGAVVLAKGDVGLSLVDNTPDAQKPISTAQQAALDLKIPLSQKGSASGVATLDEAGKVPSTQLPSYVDDVLEFGSFSLLPASGESGKIYVTLDTNLQYRWGGSAYTQVSKSLALGETPESAHRGDHGKVAYEHVAKTDNPHSVTKAQVGLGKVVNKTEAELVASGAIADALALKFDKSSIADDYDGGTTKALSAEKGKDLNARVSVLEGRKFGLYGFKKHKLTGACTPLYDSVALGPVPVIRGSRPAGFVNPYKSIRIFNWRSCLMDTKQRILAYYGQAGYDVPTHDSQSYEVEIPAAYINQWEDEYYTYRVMSEAPQLPGMFIPGCFRDNRGREMPFAYVDKYRRGVLNGYSVSRPDVLPEVSITLNAAELKAEAVDTDTLWTGCPEELDWYITFVAEIMACNTDSQAAYGQGMSSLPYSASHTVVAVTTDANTVIVSNSTANAFKVSMNVRLGNALGSATVFGDRLIQSITDNGDGTSTVVVDGDPFTTVVGYILHAHRQVTTSYEAEQIGEDCGFILHNGRSETQVENWINGIAGHGGNVYEFSFGLLRYDNYVYLCHDRYQFKHNDDPRTNASFKNVGFFEQTDGGTYGWIKNMVLVGEAPYVMEWIQELGAGSTTHYADLAYYLTPTYRGTRIVHRRFGWNNGSSCGRRSLVGSSVLSYSDWLIGWRASPSKLPKQVS